MFKAAKVGTMVAIGAAVLAVAGAGNAATPKHKIVAFTATYSGTATVQVTDQVANISASGKGTGTLIGSSSINGTGTGDASQQPCAPFTGPGTMVAGATKVAFSVVSGSQGCGDE